MARKKRVHASPMRPEIQGALWVAGLYGRLSVLDNGKVDGEPIESQIAIIRPMGQTGLTSNTMVMIQESRSPESGRFSFR